MPKKNIHFLFLVVFIVFFVVFCFMFIVLFRQLSDLKNNVFGETKYIVNNINNNSNLELKISRLVEKTKKSVAIISAYKIDNYFVESMDSFDQQISEYKMNLVGGTAFVVDSGGYLLTSKHVVDNSDFEYEVFLDGKKYCLDKIWFFDGLDLALIRIKDNNGNIPLLVPLLLSKNNTSILGSLVISFGNLVRQNIIAFLDTRITAIGQDFDIGNNIFSGLYIVGDSFPTGFSGGPVLNLSGEVVGVNIAVSNDGFSYVLPINLNLIYLFMKDK